jgi:hypothetical protein
MFNHLCLAVVICSMLAQSKIIHNLRPTCQVLSYCRILLCLHRDCTIWDDAVQTWKRLHSTRTLSGGHTWQFRYGGRVLVWPALIPSAILNPVAAWHYLRLIVIVIALSLCCRHRHADAWTPVCDCDCYNSCWWLSWRE